MRAFHTRRDQAKREAGQAGFIQELHPREAEQASRDELVSSLEEMAETASALERRVRDLAEGRPREQALVQKSLHLEAELSRACEERDALSARLEETRRQDADIGRLAIELTSERSLRTALQGDLEEALRAALEAETKCAAAERAWFALLDESETRTRDFELELEAVRNAALADKITMRDYAHDVLEQFKECDQELGLARRMWLESEQRAQALRDDISRRDALLAELSATAREVQPLERRIAELESELTAARGADQRRIGELERELAAIRIAALANEATTRSYTDDVREQSERAYLELQASSEQTYRELEASSSQRISQLETDLRDLRALHAGAMEQTDSLRERYEELRVTHDNLRLRLEGTEHQLAQRTEEFLNHLQQEETRFTDLIDTVQSSHFWQFKRWLGRLARRR